MELHYTLYISEGTILFLSQNLKNHFEFCNFPMTSVANAIVVLTELATKQVLFPHCSLFQVLLVLGNTALSSF